MVQDTSETLEEIAQDTLRYFEMSTLFERNDVVMDGYLEHRSYIMPNLPRNELWAVMDSTWILGYYSQPALIPENTPVIARIKRPSWCATPLRADNAQNQSVTMRISKENSRTSYFYQGPNSWIHFKESAPQLDRDYLIEASGLFLTDDYNKELEETFRRNPHIYPTKDVETAKKVFVRARILNSAMSR